MLSGATTDGFVGGLEAWLDAVSGLELPPLAVPPDLPELHAERIIKPVTQTAMTAPARFIVGSVSNSSWWEQSFVEVSAIRARHGW